MRLLDAEATSRALPWGGLLRALETRATIGPGACRCRCGKSAAGVGDDALVPDAGVAGAAGLPIWPPSS